MANSFDGISKELFEETFRKTLDEYSKEEQAEIIAEWRKANIPGIANLLDDYSSEEIDESTEHHRFSKIRGTFNDYFADEHDELVKMVERPKVGHVYNIQTWGSWSGRYVINKDEKGNVYLDFFASHRMTNSRHSRIFEDGRIKSLESYWEFGEPVYPDDPERTRERAQQIKDQNRQVSEILKAKGLIDEE